MERGAGNPFAGGQEPYYHHNYNHHHNHHQHGGGYHQYGQNDNHDPPFHHQHGGGYHQYGQNDNHDQRFHNQPVYDQHSNQQNGSFGGAGFGFNGGGRKRGFHSATGASPDPIHGGSFAKLYVAPIPRTTTEEEIFSVFGEHGNVIEVIIPRDKRTGERGGYCFVKYRTFEESDRAIAALQNRYTFPGEVAAIKVRYADGDRDRIGFAASPVPVKLYVGCLHRQTTKMEIQEVFSVYGFIEDIYIVRDELKQSRGCAFVQFSHREMALAAIKALNGVFTMTGCDQPLIVRFADPKKPRNGETRVTPNAAYPMQQFGPNLHPQAVSQWPNQEFAGPRIRQQQGTASTHFPQQSSQSCQPAVSEVHNHMGHDTSPQNLEQQQKSEDARLEASSEPKKIASDSSETPQDQQRMVLECDWSQHTCPDGYKYYYNCVTCESTWQKPEEYSLFEKQREKQKESQVSAILQSPPPKFSCQEAAPDTEVQDSAKTRSSSPTGSIQDAAHSTGVQASAKTQSPSPDCLSQEAAQNTEVRASAIPRSPSPNSLIQNAAQNSEEQASAEIQSPLICSSQDAAQDTEVLPHTDLLQQKAQDPPTSLPIGQNSFLELENIEAESKTSLAAGATCA